MWCTGLGKECSGGVRGSWGADGDVKEAGLRAVGVITGSGSGNPGGAGRGGIRRTDHQCMSEVKERKAFRTIPGLAVSSCSSASFHPGSSS